MHDLYKTTPAHRVSFATSLTLGKPPNQAHQVVYGSIYMIYFSSLSLRLFILFGWMSCLLPDHDLTAQPATQGVDTTSRYDSAAINRLADFGRVWGVIRYFHPLAGKDKLDTDSLVIDYLEPLLARPTTGSFQRALAQVFTRLGDTHSGIMTPNSLSASTTWFKERPHLVYRHLPMGEGYLALSQQACQKPIRTDSLIEQLDSQSMVVVDLRNEQINNALGLAQYTQFVQPLISQLIEQPLVLPTARSFYYHGLLRQDFPDELNLLPTEKDGRMEQHYQVYYGLRNMSEGVYLPANPLKKRIKTKICFLINRFVNVNSLKAIMALHHRQGCRVILEGDMPDYMYGEFYRMTLVDQVLVKIRTSEVIYEDGTLGSDVDQQLSEQADTAWQAPLIRQAAQLLHQPFPPLPLKAVQNTVYIRYPQSDYPVDKTPSAVLRLLGLFNGWNTIHYFSPNKALLALSWEKALPRFIPQFLAASTDSLYFMALMNLTGSLRDGHSILISKRGGRSPKGLLDGNLPIGVKVFGQKTYIINVLADTTQTSTLAQIQPGDELVRLDQQTPAQLAAQWRDYLPASNQAGFEREFYMTWLTVGRAGSRAQVTLKRNGQYRTVWLRRIPRDHYYSLWGQTAPSPKLPPSISRLEGNIGYLRINRLYSSQLDSIANYLKDCPVILLDCRGYPRDSQFGSHLASYIAHRTDTVALNRFPFLFSPHPSQQLISTEYQIVQPSRNVFLKHKHYLLLVDEGVQSQGEGNVIGLQGVSQSITVGTPTAGANGMAITMMFPGGYFSFFSGFGEYYPDNTPNQKLGVKLDKKVPLTLRGYLAGRDEIYEQGLRLAKQFVNARAD
jgi:hypothetical protein